MPLVLEKVVHLFGSCDKEPKQTFRMGGWITTEAELISAAESQMLSGDRIEIATAPVVWEVPAVNLPALESALEKCNKRALKLGCSPAKLIPLGTVNREREWECPTTGRKTKYIVVYHRFNLDADGAPKLDGWSFVAAIDHVELEDGERCNLLRRSPHYQGDLPKSYRTDAPTCDHCRTLRQRHETFVVQHEDGRMNRVGRDCLKDFTGHESALSIINSATWLRDLMSVMNEGCGEAGVVGGVWHFSAIEVFARTAQAIRTLGWMSRSKAREWDKTATADEVWSALTWWLRKQPPGAVPPEDCAEQDNKDAVDTMEWVREIPAETDNDYLHNLRAACLQGAVGPKELGLACSAVAAFYRERSRQLFLERAASKPSNWVGTVGERFGGKAKGAKPPMEVTVLGRHSFDGMYGLTTIVRMQTDDGDDLVWFASGYVPDEAVPGVRVSLTGTIKKHEVYAKTGRKQTTMARCEIVVLDAPMEAK